MRTRITQQEFEAFEAVYKTSMEITRNNLDPEVFDKLAAEHFISKGKDKGDDDPVWIAWHQNKLYPEQTIDNLRLFLYPVVSNNDEPPVKDESDLELTLLKEIRDNLDKLIALKSEKLF